MSRTKQTSALLTKAGMQLRGEKPRVDDDEEELQMYLAGLGKQSPSKDWTISDNSDDDMRHVVKIKANANNKFLKKTKEDTKQPTAAPQTDKSSSRPLPKNVLRISDSSDSTDNPFLNDAADLEPAKDFQDTKYTAAVAHSTGPQRGVANSHRGRSTGAAIGSQRGGATTGIGSQRGLATAGNGSQRGGVTAGVAGSQRGGATGGIGSQRGGATGGIGSQRGGATAGIGSQRGGTTAGIGSQRGGATAGIGSQRGGMTAGVAGSLMGGANSAQSHGGATPNVRGAHQALLGSVGRGSQGGHMLNRQISEDEESSSLGLGKGGNKFLKPKQQQQDTPQEVAERVLEPKKVEKRVQEPATRKDMFTLRSSERHATTVTLDTDEESLRGYIDDIRSRSEEDPKVATKNNSPTLPRTPRSVTPLRGIKEDEEDRTISSNSDGFKLQIMDIEELEAVTNEDHKKGPNTPRTIVAKPSHTSKKSPRTPRHTDNRDSKSSKTQKKKPTTSRNKTKDKNDVDKKDFFSSHNIQTIDDLLIGDVLTSEQSELDERSTSPLRGILTASPDMKTPRSTRSRVRYSIDEEIPTEIGGATTAPYTEDFDQSETSIQSELETDRNRHTDTDIQTDTGRQLSTYTDRRSPSYADQQTITSRQSDISRYKHVGRKEERARPRSDTDRQIDTDAYTEDFVSDASRPTSPLKEDRKKAKEEHKSKPGRAKKPSVHHTGVQTIPQSYDPGLVYPSPLVFDPRPMVNKVVDPKALEALCMLNPTDLLLSNLMRQQLELTMTFVHNTKILYENLLNTCQPDYHYTTLEETQEYIQKQRKLRRKHQSNDEIE